MTDLTDVLNDITRLFEESGREYAIMGGFAVRALGIPRPTYDIDFTVALGRDELPKLFQEIETLGYSVPAEYQSGWIDEVAGMPLIRFRLWLAGEGRSLDVDIFLAESEFQRSLITRRQRCDLGGITAWLVSAEDLILLKLLAHRPRDLSDIADVRFTQGQLDEDYLRTWADKLGIRDKLDAVLAEPPI